MNVYIDPQVKLIDNLDKLLGYKIWLGSRDSIVSRENGKLKVGNEVFDNEDEYVDRIYKMSLQYNNFPTYVFEIQGSALFRDLIFSVNKIGQWATSLRFLHSLFEGFDKRNYPISSEYKGIKSWEDQFDKFMKKIHETNITDENRMEMPYSMSSKYWVCINHKSLIGFLSMIKLKMPFFYEVYGKLFIQCIKESLNLDIEKYLINGVEPSIDQYFYRSKFSESYNEVDDIVILKKKMGLLLYSQFIRQSDTIIKGLFNELVHDDIEIFKNKMFYAGTELNVTYIADKTKFMKTISNRTCWFSMSSGNNINSWSSILDLVIKDMSVEDFMELLPCQFNKLPELEYCKYRDDVKFRDEGLEKRNLGCAILNRSLELAEKRNNYDNTNLSRLYLETVKKLLWMKNEGV